MRRLKQHKPGQIRSHRAPWRAGAAGLTALAIGTQARAAIQFGQIDDFQDGTTMDWIEGESSPNPPVNIPTGGPAGAGDMYLQDLSSGIGSAGSKQIMFNDAQWTGDYLSGHVTMLTADMANFGDTTLYMRVTIQNAFQGFIFSSINPQVIPPDGLWHPVGFDLTPTGMTELFGGTDPITGVLSNVTEMRILSSQSGPAINGDSIESTLGMDNLRALTLPGDANFDNTVNTQDFTILANHFNSTSPDWSTGDFNFDGNVNALDFNALASNFGSSISLGAAPLARLVPEPSAALLIAAWIARRTRRRHQVFCKN